MNNYENSPSYIQRNERLQTEINKHKVNIDRKVFVKTEHERSLLAQAKLKHKKRLANKPQFIENRDKFVQELLTHTTPNWGSIKIDLERI